MSRLDVDAMAAEVVLLVKTALGPVMERLAAAEARIAPFSDVRDRVIAAETKAALQPAPDRLNECLARLTTLETRPALVPEGLSERLTALEGKSLVAGKDGQDGAIGPPGKDGAPGPVGERGSEGPTGTPGRDGDRGPIGEKGLDGLIGPAGERGPEGPAGSGRDGRDGLLGVPGVPGEKGLDGVPGAPGLNGRDGTLEHIKALFDGERTVTLCFKDGTPIDGGVIVFPVEIYRGVYQEGKTYERGDGATFGGSEWHANATTTTKPGDGSSAWTLKVKRGQNGRDGKDGTPGPQGQPGKDWRQG